MQEYENIENFFLDMDLPYEQLDEGMWVIMSPNLGNLVVYVTGTALSFRVKLFEFTEDSSALYRRLLELNATEMVHGAYGIEDNAVVIVDSLELEHLDANEFRATIESIGLAMTSHYPVLSALISSSEPTPEEAS